ncbi:hypothetical protein HDU79_006865 [Rhizoclosmatium sp. JEL0117]|nr:hypothetical protein HDU79_006865 [Rhizoclosmatium sp. JEL0117]
MPKFTVPSYSLFLVSALIHTAIAATGLLLLRAPAAAQAVFGDLTVQDFILPGLSSKAGDLGFEMWFTAMLSFAGLPAILVYVYSPKDRKALLPIAIPMAIYHLFHLIVLFSSFVGDTPVLGPAQSALPVVIGNLLNELVKTYRIRLWIANALVHFVLYVWHVVWIIRVQETGGIPGMKLVKEKKE